MTIKRFDSINPELKITCALVFLAGKGDLGSLFTKKIGDFLVGYCASLVIMEHNLSVLVADAADASVHKRIACFVFSANVAIYPSPARVAIACTPGSHRPASASGQRATQRLETIIATETFRAVTFPIELVAACILGTDVGGQKAIKTRRTVVGSFIH